MPLTMVWEQLKAAQEKLSKHSDDAELGVHLEKLLSI